MRKIAWIILLAFILGLAGCSCNKTPEIATAKKATDLPKTKQAVKETPKQDNKVKPKAAKKDASKFEKMTNKSVNPKTLKKMLPDLEKKLKSPEFDKAMRQSIEDKDFKGLMMTILAAQEEVCKQHGIELKDFLQYMSDNKDDPRMKDMIKKWQEAIVKHRGMMQ